MVTIRNTVPIRTCKPWKPVATKNVVPKTLSETVKDATEYSNHCKNVK